MVAFDARALASSLTGGMEIHDFDREVRERRAARFEAAIGLEQVGQLCSLSRLEALFTQEAIPLQSVDVFDDGHLKKLVDVQNRSGKSGLAVVADSFRKGSTIRVRDLDRFDARLHRFVDEVRRRFAAQSQVNVYLTPPSKTGFPPHFDNTDVFIVQCAGKKEWRIFHDYADKKELPLMETIWDPDRFTPSASAEAVTLRPGDVLYLPRGEMHQAYCTDRESMHLTVSVVPLTFADLLGKAVRRAAEADIELRRRVPWSTEGHGGAHDDLDNQARERLLAVADSIDVDALLTAERLAFEEVDPESGAGELESAVAMSVEAFRALPRT